jgi:hypothetical protein
MTRHRRNPRQIDSDDKTRGARKLFGAAGFVTALALTACSSSGGGGHATDTATTASTTAKTTTTLAPTTTTALPPPYSFDGSVPAPELINTGTDYEAIYRSIDAYSHWLYSHHPDESLIAEVYAPGSEAYDNVRDDVRTLVDGDYRVYDTASVIEKVEVATALPDVVTLRVHYTDDREEIVRRDGTVTDSEQLPSPSIGIVLIRADTAGRWRVASAELQQ